MSTALFYTDQQTKSTSERKSIYRRKSLDLVTYPYLMLGENKHQGLNGLCRCVVSLWVLQSFSSLLPSMLPLWIYSAAEHLRRFWLVEQKHDQPVMRGAAQSRKPFALITFPSHYSEIERAYISEIRSDSKKRQMWRTKTVRDTVYQLL